MDKEIKASVDYSLSALLYATRELCNTILQEIKVKTPSN